MFHYIGKHENRRVWPRPAWDGNGRDDTIAGFNMRYYTEDHEWIEVNGDEAIVGITEYAADQLEEVEEIEFPDEDDSFIVGDRMGSIKAGNITLELPAPISGTIKSINEMLSDEPELLLESPEDKGWICRMNEIDESELDDLMNANAYARFLEER